ncbi:hypothetical protein [Limisalsivibrio acetivorans]|uniref:hypothetical protein n=1 Tax=Limisalsivibrio acetivorans TaxID=1304888 RepID=UPI0003B60944|nr:hypothetical protein [Limisalsivibrio acetivorans]
MSLLKVNNLGQAAEAYSLVHGVVTGVDKEGNTLDIDTGELLTGVPVLYHCTPDSEEVVDGSIAGASSAFSVGDEVLLLCGATDRVIGFADELRPCCKVKYAYLAEGGWLISKCGETEPYELITNDEFDEGYEEVSQAGTGLFSIMESAVDIDECVERIDRILLRDGSGVMVVSEYYDSCLVDRWGEWIEIKAQASVPGLDIAVIEHTRQTITTNTSWDTNTKTFLYINGKAELLYEMNTEWRPEPDYNGLVVLEAGEVYRLDNGRAAFSLTAGTPESTFHFAVHTINANNKEANKYPFLGYVDYNGSRGEPLMKVVTGRRE